MTSAARKAGRVAVIAGAGPAGLTGALEMLKRSDITPVVFEAESQVGGISKTINYRGNRMDLGGHRFFSKSDWVMRWWRRSCLWLKTSRRRERRSASAINGESGTWSPDIWRSFVRRRIAGSTTVVANILSAQILRLSA